MAQGDQRTRRIIQELRNLDMEPVPGIEASPIDNADVTKWFGTIKGPVDTPYAGGTFKVDINFPETYPFKPPHLKFVTKVYHPNVGPEGDICLDTLKHNWSPALQTSKVLLSLMCLLATPNPDDPLVPAIAEEYKTNRAKFDKTAAEWTKTHAMQRL